MSRRGNCHDNAVAESFFNLLKRERIRRRTYKTREDATQFCLTGADVRQIPIIKRKVVPDSIVCSDCWRGYNVQDVTDCHHFRINHSTLFADRHNHINGVENIWNQAKRHLRKFKDVPKAQFSLYLKECERRFNNSDPSRQLLLLRQWVKPHLK